ncbi:hypothetical protein CAPTEDRAFT_211226 [Capitella teleta]|uniref:Major facilitator superfamily (MFS) profile domain-containing protein n=1 Tax=Capitella teleta TaxID=283909 RepID=R7UQZ2_CAPTE|nr:hypothetical protein CAPTEDRAFT_211226 [Capitella teleta]|eukprot:ELU08565.1 hypothetical protein CAPTEDRAFT_211226 [Capitella teleta]
MHEARKHGQVAEAEEEEEEEEGGGNESDPDRKLKIMKTILLYFGVFDVGLCLMLIGPTLLDLGHLVSADTATMSIVVICRALGSIAGNFASGCLIGHVNPWFMSLLTKFIGASFVIIIPWCRSYLSLALCFVPWGFAIGLFDAIGNNMILIIWGRQNGPWMQGFYCVLSMGSLVAPLIAEPFLQEKPQNALTSGQIGISTPAEKSETQIVYVYLMTGIYMITAGVGFTCMFLLETPRMLLAKSKDNKKEEENAPDPLESVNRVFYGIFLTFLAVMYTAYCAAEASFGVYLLTFAVKYLNWNQQQAAMVTAALMGAFTAGRALGIPLVIVLRPSVIILVDLISMVSMLAILSAFVNVHDAVLWVCSIGFGFAMASFYGSGFSWVEHRIGVRTRVNAMILVASAVGELVGPSTVGPIMGTVGYNSFVYLILTFVVVALISFIALEVLSIKVNDGNSYEKLP